MTTTKLGMQQVRLVQRLTRFALHQGEMVDAEKAAIKTLAARGLAQKVEHFWVLTDAGKKVAEELEGR